jgi:hypothetical protein
MNVLRHIIFGYNLSKIKNIYLKVKLPEKVPYPSLFNFNYRKKGSEGFELLTFNQ